MKTSVLFLVIVVIVGCSCNLNQELINSVKNMQYVSPDADYLVNDCEFQRYFWSHQTDRNSLNAIGEQFNVIRWLKGDHGRHFFRPLKDLKYGTRAMSLTFENHISTHISGVIAKALIGYRNGDSVSASIAVATSSCGMVQQYNPHTFQRCNQFLFWRNCHDVTEYHARGYHPHELNNVLAKLQSTASSELYGSVAQNTGLTADNSGPILESLYIEESQVLRRYYPEIAYEYIELNDVPHHEFIAAVHEASQGSVHDMDVLNRILQVAASTPSSSFFFSPHNNLLYVIAVNLTETRYFIRMSAFTVDGRLPGGSFATSVGAWNLERAGNPVNPSVHELLGIFPPLK